MEHIFRQWIGMHRAMIAWFHAAHHVTKGTGFGGDHVNLYGEIYTQLDEDLDGIVEKGIGLTGDETLADPVSSLSMAAGLLAQQPASANQDAETIAGNGLIVIKYYVEFIEAIYRQFESLGMSLGLDDLLQGHANQYETYVYLLQQRARTGLLQKESKMRLTESQLRKAIRTTILEAKAGDPFGDKTYAIWSHIKHLSARFGKGQRDEPSVTKAMKYIASTAGYVMRGMEMPDGRDPEDFGEDFIMDYAQKNRKKSIKSYCWAFMTGMHQLLSIEGQDPMSNYFDEVYRILRQDGVI